MPRFKSHKAINIFEFLRGCLVGCGRICVGSTGPCEEGRGSAKGFRTKEGSYEYQHRSLLFIPEPVFVPGA
jgi:hypothetical protein